MLPNGLDSHAKPLRFVDLEFGESGSHSLEFRKLPLLTLETTEQQNALQKLVAKGKYVSQIREFQDHVLRLLGLISDNIRVKGKGGPTSRKSRDRETKTRNLASRVRSLAGVLETFGRPTPDFPLAPTNELRHYAHELERCADSIRRARAGLIPKLITAQKRKKRPPRNTKKIANELIVVLDGLVRKVTGEDHDDELTILLRCATGDRGYNNHRLQQLRWEDKESKKKRGRLATALAFYRTI